MNLIAAFVLVSGTPFVLAVSLYAAPIPKTKKAAAFSAVLGGLALLIYVPNYTLADIGSPELLLLVAVAWIIGFLLAPIPVSVWRLGRIALKR